MHKSNSHERSLAAALSTGALLFLSTADAAAQQEKQLDEVVVSASRSEQKRFDAAASIDAVQVDPLRAASPLVNLSELLGTVPGIQIRERQNYAQDLQLSVRGFGTRSTFGVRGVRVLVDGIPATMPDGQGQAATATLTSARRIEILRGPVAQLYGNAAGGVVQVFTAEPPLAPQKPYASASVGAGSDGQRQFGFTLAGGSEALGGLLDVSHYETDGYRDHSAAERTQVNAKVLWRPSPSTKITGIVNVFDQPLAQDPLGLTRAQFERNPRQVAPVALSFDTRKTIEQQQAGLLFEHKLDRSNTLNARLYAGTREVFQTLSFSGVAATSSGGVIDLDNHYRGAGLSWTHAMQAGGMPLNWTVGMEADDLDQTRRGFVNNNGTPGALRRDERDNANNVDVFGQVDWTFAEQWKATAGLRSSRVRLSVDDRYVTAASPDDSGSVEYRNTSPVLGLVWYAADNLNFYANLGRGFETPTLAESAYRAGATGPNLGLQPSKSRQGEVGMKWRSGAQSVDLAVFTARSRDEIVPQATENGRSIFQNIDSVERRGIEASWRSDMGGFGTQLAYTLLDARFKRGYASGGGAVAAGNRLPGAPMHSLFAQLEARPLEGLSTAVEMRAESRTYVDDLNSETAPGYAVFNLRAAQEFRAGATNWTLFGRIDNVFDRHYAGSVIVNDGNRRFFEPAPGRRFFIGLRALL
ncbi:TonB-dependent receptor [Noviherbaspirillum sp. CPCC 100848]|uniref:TonB-dependent receptor n=1 Tax=Noviherbaspirillum album TaxID=3080276 RepID=A0ABU6J2E4_9BURK|nr:TonB-dependent receptor [Noviherbaspirillum sp. CPCC 100848]MEC4717804.1 TonB-dependent receptor [Noviherbaspirillum sp. CPCC 100848]